MRPIFSLAIVAIIAGCGSGQSSIEAAKDACRPLYEAKDFNGFAACYDRAYAQTSAQRSAASLQMIQMGAQMMQGPPRPTVTTTNCMAYGGNSASCTSVQQ